MKRLAAFVLLLAGIGSAYASDGDAERLRAWRAGEKVTEEAVAEYGIDRWFRQFGDRRRTPRAHVRQILQAGLHRPRSELRYLRGLHRNLAGETLLGELVCNEAISGDLLEIFRALYDAAYPIERMVLIDEYDAQDGPSIRANNSSAFNFRFIAGTGVLSNHSRGMAVDINPLYTPYVKTNGGRTVVAPRGSCPLCRTEAGFPLQDRRGRPLLPGVPAPRIHLGRPLEKPEGLPAFREKAIAARKPQHCAGRPPAVISGRQRSIRNRSRVFRDSIRPVRDNTKAPDLSRSGAFFPSGIPGFSGDRIILRRRVFPSAKNCRTRP